MSDKPKMYQSKIFKEFNNNKKVYASYDDQNIKIIDRNDIRKKINSIINSNEFIYRANVNINIDNKIVTKKIIGIHDNNLITIDNEYIPIDMIKDIEKVK